MTIRSIICSLCLSLLYTKASAIDYSSLSPKKNWLYKEVADISSSRYLLYKDTIKNELCASYYSNLEESAKAIKVPSKISYEGKTYIVRDVDMDYTGGGQNVESVSLPTTVVSIDHLLCPALSQIKIPSSTTYIGSEAFSGCNSFVSVEIPNSVCKLREIGIGYLAKVFKRYWQTYIPKLCQSANSKVEQRTQTCQIC